MKNAATLCATKRWGIASQSRLGNPALDMGFMAIIKITDNNQRAETSVGNQGTIPEPKHE